MRRVLSFATLATAMIAMTAGTRDDSDERNDRPPPGPPRPPVPRSDVSNWTPPQVRLRDIPVDDQARIDAAQRKRERRAAKRLEAERIRQLDRASHQVSNVQEKP